MWDNLPQTELVACMWEFVLVKHCDSTGGGSDLVPQI